MTRIERTALVPYQYAARRSTSSRRHCTNRVHYSDGTYGRTRGSC